MIFSNPSIFWLAQYSGSTSMSALNWVDQVSIDAIDHNSFEGARLNQSIGFCFLCLIVKKIICATISTVAATTHHGLGHVLLGILSLDNHCCKCWHNHPWFELFEYSWLLVLNQAYWWCKYALICKYPCDGVESILWCSCLFRILIRNGLC